MHCHGLFGDTALALHMTQGSSAMQEELAEVCISPQHILSGHRDLYLCICSIISNLAGESIQYCNMHVTLFLS